VFGVVPEKNPMRGILTSLSLALLFELADSFTAVTPFNLRPAVSHKTCYVPKGRTCRVSMCQEVDATQQIQKTFRKGLSCMCAGHLDDFYATMILAKSAERRLSLILSCGLAGPATLDERTTWNMKLSLAKPVEGVFSAAGRYPIPDS
jgi:hypothetical protein